VKTLDRKPSRSRPATCRRRRVGSGTAAARTDSLPAENRSDGRGWRTLPLLAVVVVAMVSGSISGCGRTHPFDMEQVSGVVTYEDGSLIPAERIVIRFEPLSEAVSEQVHPKAATSVVDPADGSFGKLSTFRYGDGVVSGRHRVLLVAVAGGGADANQKPLIPPEYGDPDKTPLEVDTADSPFKFSIPKP
jgi:hypothetical protein